MPVNLVDDEANNAFHIDPRVRETPKYSISRGVDDVLQWEPPIRSRELANALSYHYPLEESLQEKMQRAILDFFESETSTGKTAQETFSIDFKSPIDMQPQKLVTVTGEAGPIISESSENASVPFQSVQIPEVFQVWDIRTGELVKPKGRKRGLSPMTRQRVAENRGNICAFHRKARTRCDPTQCRQNKLYPGTTIGPKSAKGADQKKRDRKGESPSNESEILNRTLATGTSHGFNFVKRVKGLPSLSPSLPKLAAQRNDSQMQLSNHGCHRPRSKPSLDRESDHLSVIPFAKSSGFPGEATLLGGTNDPESPLAENLLASSLHSQQNSDDNKLFPTLSSKDVNLGLKPATMSQLSFQKDTTVQRDWISGEEMYSSGNFNWVKDLMASDLTSLEFDWPREEAGEMATLADLGSSPNTLFDFGSFGLDAMGGLLVDSQSHGLSPGQNFEYGQLKQATGDAENYIGELADVPQVGSSQSASPFELPSSLGSTFAPQASSISEPQIKVYENSIDAALAPPKAVRSTKLTDAEGSIPIFAKSQEEILDKNKWPRRLEGLRHRRLTTDKKLPWENTGEYSSSSILKPQSSQRPTSPIEDLNGMNVIPSTLTSGGKSTRDNDLFRSRTALSSNNYYDKLVDVATTNRADRTPHRKSLGRKRQKQVIVSDDIPASQVTPELLPESSMARPASDHSWPSAHVSELNACGFREPTKAHCFKFFGVNKSDRSTFSPETTAISIDHDMARHTVADTYAAVEITEAKAYRRARSRLDVLLEKPADAAEELWEKMREMKL